MATPFETVPQITPLEAFVDAVHTRQLELGYLAESLTTSIEFISDLDRVNERIAASPRPELTLNNPAAQRQITWPFRHRRINNFIPSLRAFGPRVFEMRPDWSSGGEKLTDIGRRPPTREELDAYFLIGARGDYHESSAFAQANGIPKDTADDMFLQTFVNEPAFMRMWILFPELTERLLVSCVDDPYRPKSVDEEIFVAYSIMSRLVDKEDRGVTQEDGTIDDWALCH